MKKIYYSPTVKQIVLDEEFDLMATVSSGEAYNPNDLSGNVGGDGGDNVDLTRGQNSIWDAWSD